MDFTSPQFRINGHAPEPSDYNVTHSFSPHSTFCLKNITERSVVTEWCEYLANDDFCRPGVGLIIFLSRTEIIIQDHMHIVTSRCMDNT